MENSNIILNKLTAIESLLEATHETKPLTLLEAAKFLNLSQSHLYKLTSERKIPHFKPKARRFILISQSLYSGLNATLPEPRKKQKKKRQAILFPEEELYET